MKEPDFGKSVFICSKPFQFLVCASIVRAYAVREPEIWIVRAGIADADDFLHFLRSSSYNRLFFRIHECMNHPEAVDAIRHLDHDSLFIEDDRVSKYRMFERLKTRYMVVFEEGFGTYRNDYRDQLRHLRKLKWLLLSALTGCGLYFGHGRETNYVLVQYPGLYGTLNPETAGKALPIPSLLSEFSHSRSDWDGVIQRSAIPFPDINSKVALVLGTWGGAPSARIRDIAAAHDVVYYKAHPDDRSMVGAEELMVIGASWVPVEVFIDYLAASCAALTVYHFASTAYMNCLGHFDNVTFVALGEDARVTEVCEHLRRASEHQRRS